MEDFAKTKIKTINGMPIPSCSAIVTLKALDVIPVTKFILYGNKINK
jgi:hypothetical protein